MTVTTVRGDLQDRVRAALLSYGQKEINLTVDDLIGKTGLNYSQVYQALYRLARIGELEIIREPDPRNLSQRVTGVRLFKMEPIEVVTKRSVERTTNRQSEKDFSAVSVSVPNILEYLNQKLAVERAKEELSKAKINPDITINFEPNPIGEEAIFLLSKLQETIEQNKTLSHDLAAEKRNVQFYKERSGSATYDDSGT